MVTQTNLLLFHNSQSKTELDHHRSFSDQFQLTLSALDGPANVTCDELSALFVLLSSLSMTEPREQFDAVPETARLP